MHDFLVKEVINDNLAEELTDIGFDKTYADRAVKKYLYKNLKVFDLTIPQANILKQTALSVGADCATHREVITGKIELSSCMLGGSLSQIHKIAEKLESQPFGLKFLGEKLIEQCNISDRPKTKIMGILNLTQNSFSDGGEFYDYDNAIKHLNELIGQGADIIDIGAESTKPFSSAVSADVQLQKLIPVLNYIKEQNVTIPISIDTRSSIVAEECIKSGAAIINDVSGFDYDENMAEIITKYPHTKVVIQHSLGTPENMQISPMYNNLMDELFISMYKKVEFALSKGISKSNIIIDPGIGFGKIKSHNFEILNRWQELKSIGCPVLIGLSRKSLLDMPQDSNEEKDIYSLALNSILINQGVDFIRVHNVAMHRKFIDIID